MPLLLQPRRAWSGERRAQRRGMARGAHGGGRNGRLAGASLRWRAGGTTRSGGSGAPRRRGRPLHEPDHIGDTAGRAPGERAFRGRARSRSRSAFRTPTTPTAIGSRACKGRRPRSGRSRRWCGEPECRSRSTWWCIGRISSQLGAMLDMAAASRRRADRGRACAILWLGAGEPRGVCCRRARNWTRRRRRWSARARAMQGALVIDYVVPDYYARLPKSCMGGWGRRFLTVNPIGLRAAVPRRRKPSRLRLPLGAQARACRNLARFRRLQSVSRHRLDAGALRRVRSPRDRLGRVPMSGVRAAGRRRCHRSGLRQVAASCAARPTPCGSRAKRRPPSSIAASASRRRCRLP